MSNQEIMQEQPARDEFDFSGLAPKERPVVGPDGRKYILREASEGAAKKYRGAALSGAEMTFDEASDTRTMRRMSSIAEVQSLLVAECLFVQPENHLVTRQFLESWPSRTVKAMFDWIKEASDLEEKVDLASLRQQRARINARISRCEAEERTEGNGVPSGTGSSS